MKNTQTLQIAESRALLSDAILVLTGSLFIALCSQIAVQFPFTPVPFTLQAQSVLLVSYLLGAKRGFYAVSAFLLQGAMGLPVFAHGGLGMLTLLGPSGGYLMSYPLVSLLVGWLSSRDRQAHASKTLGIFLAGNALIFLCGAAWLALFAGASAAWSCGVYPFLLSDLLKVVLLTLTLPLWRKAAQWLV